MLIINFAMNDYKYWAAHLHPWIVELCTFKCLLIRNVWVSLVSSVQSICLKTRLDRFDWLHMGKLCLIEIFRAKSSWKHLWSQLKMHCVHFLRLKRNRVRKINKSQASSGTEVNLGPKWTGNNHALVMKQRRVSQIKNLSRYPNAGPCAILIPLSFSAHERETQYSSAASKRCHLILAPLAPADRDNIQGLFCNRPNVISHRPRTFLRLDGGWLAFFLPVSHKAAQTDKKRRPLYFPVRPRVRGINCLCALLHPRRISFILSRHRLEAGDFFVFASHPPRHFCFCDTMPFV